jgi:hypothetical protein
MVLPGCPLYYSTYVGQFFHCRGRRFRGAGWTCHCGHLRESSAYFGVSASPCACCSDGGAARPDPGVQHGGADSATAIYVGSRDSGVCRSHLVAGDPLKPAWDSRTCGTRAAAFRIAAGIDLWGGAVASVSVGRRLAAERETFGILLCRGRDDRDFHFFDAECLGVAGGDFAVRTRGNCSWWHHGRKS